MHISWPAFGQPTSFEYELHVHGKNCSLCRAICLTLDEAQQEAENFELQGHEGFILRVPIVNGLADYDFADKYALDTI